MARKKDFTYVSGKKYDGMMSRCYRETDASYKHYSGRGIKVCEAWVKDINVFRAWLLGQLDRQGISVETFIKNAKTFQLDRVDSLGHYTPDNCRISNPQENTRNRAATKVRSIVTAEGTVVDLKSVS